jgi:putative FmdB family regulatory protein
MPIYEYTCKACGAESEIMQKLSEPPAKECPVCHKKKLVKTISAAGFRLSGGGWYETDFKSGNKKNLAGDKGGDSAAACAPTGCEKPGCAAKVETKSETKTKTESKSEGKKSKPKPQAAAA